MSVKYLAVDPRWFQLFFSIDLFVLWAFMARMDRGLVSLSFHHCRNIDLSLPGGDLAQETMARTRGIGVQKRADKRVEPCLLLKTGHWYTSLLAVWLTVASKYLIRIKGKHIFNPSAFGIVATLLISKDAWLSPGQWGSDVILFFLTIVVGTIVVTRVQKLDTSFAFLLTYMYLTWWRQVYVLGWPMDHFIHSITTGSLLIFSFFMISDPRTSPDHPFARILWERRRLWLSWLPCSVMMPRHFADFMPARQTVR